MKKLFFLFVMMVVAIGAQAQDIETLVPTEIEVDPMLNPDGGTKWSGMYVNVFEYPGKTPHIVFKCADHVFVDKLIRVGYYSDKDSLLYMTRDIGRVNSSGTRMMIVRGIANDSIPYAENQSPIWYVYPEQILRWLKETDGYLRVLAPIYGDRYHEIKFRLKK